MSNVLTKDEKSLIEKFIGHDGDPIFGDFESEYEDLSLIFKDGELLILSSAEKDYGNRFLEECEQRALYLCLKQKYEGKK